MIISLYLAWGTAHAFEYVCPYEYDVMITLTCII